MQSQTIQVRLSKRRRLCLILIGCSWKKASKHIVILDHLYGEILDPLDITPIRGEIFMKICLRLHQLLAIYSNTNEKQTSLTNVMKWRKISIELMLRRLFLRKMSKLNLASKNLCIWAWLSMKSVTILTGILVTCMILISSIVRNL